MTIPNNWYEDFFHGVTLDLWRQAIPPQQTKAEAEFLIKHLNCELGSQLLDVPCGNGRLSFELAGRGYRVTGVDLSAGFIEEALANSQTITGGTPVPQFILGDMRGLEGDHVYDGAYCFGNSFGFMEYADMEKFVTGVSRSLKGGARFLVETGMAAESVLPDFEEQASYDVGDMVMSVKERYLATESCIDSEYTFERKGKSETRLAKHWIYTVAEIRRMLKKAGFSILDCYGSLESEPYKLGNQELFVIAERI
jgi:cyclopropane fatty-acyl-phospholipid synthase-like methyltransferase